MDTMGDVEILFEHDFKGLLNYVLGLVRYLTHTNASQGCSLLVLLS